MISTRLLEKGVAVRVCFPDGTIRPVLPFRANAGERALGEMGFAVDKTIGMIERQGQTLARRFFSLLGGGD